MAHLHEWSRRWWAGHCIHHLRAALVLIIDDEVPIAEALSYLVEDTGYVPATATLASPETAERIAVLEAATSGSLSELDSARLNVQWAGHNLALLDGLGDLGGLHGSLSEREDNAVSRVREELATLTPPLASRSEVTHGASGLLTIALVDDAPVAHGRTWTADE